MENLNREAILRMLSGKAGNSSSGGGGGDIDLAGYATSIWVTQNFVSIDFFRELFKAYDSNGNEVIPNDTETVIDNIKAMFGFWTDQYLSALGQGSGGGGGGGAEALSDLLDVELTTLQNGQALIYSSALGKWTNGTAGVNMTQVWSALDSATNEQINASHLSTALSGYVTTSAISDMATQTWVGQQGYATQTWVGQNYISIAFFDRLFQAYEGTGSSATRVNPNDTTSTIDNIKAMFGFWTEFYLSALGDGGASSGSISLGMLSDVSLSSPTDGQALVFDATLGIWKNGTVSGTDMATVWTNLAAATNEQINASHLTTALSGYALTSQLSAYNPTNNFKTINGNSIIGTGDINVGGGGGAYLPLSGGTMTGAIKFDRSNSTQYIYSIFNYSDTFQITLLNKNSVQIANQLVINPNSASFRNLDNTRQVVISNGSVNLWARTETNIGWGNGINIYSGSGTFFGSAAGAFGSGRDNFTYYYYGGDYNTSAIYIKGVTNGNVGIGTSSPSYKLHVAGSIYATGGVTALSDARHKTIINPICLQVEQIARMPAVAYRWNDGREDNGLHVGSIAQDWQRILPEVVMRSNDKEGTLSMQYGVAALVSSIITARKVVDHEKRIADLERENKELKLKLKIA